MRTTFTPHDHQNLFLVNLRNWLETAQPGSKRCYASPTGTGKSLMELWAQEMVPGAWIVTPRVEIIQGMLAKLGITLIRVSDEAIAAEGWRHKITTPVRLRNAMLKGELDDIPFLIVDEGHHAEASTYRDIEALSGSCPAICLTATPFRGTPAGTAKFRATWGQPVHVLTYPNAVRQNLISMPVCRILPLVDDDLITVENGEFVVEAVGAAVQSRLSAAVEHCRQYHSGAWDRPTMFSVPNTECARQLCDALNAAGLPARTVVQDTPQTERQQAFLACIDCSSALVQINVVSEGVDLPIRRLIDLAPTMSPVKWLQQLGRITRPGGVSEYVCTNRNLLRHAYLLEGCLPPSVLVEATKAFGVGTRAASRVIGLEALGRFKGAELPLSDGTTGIAYQLASADGLKVTEYAVLVHPGKANPVWARRQRTKATENSKATYGRWARCNPPEGLTGFASVPPAPLSPAQTAWWKKSAVRFGLDPDAEVTRKNFVALPVLSDLRQRL